MHVTARRRTKGSMPWVLVEAIWRRKHHGDLWGGLIKSLKEVAFSRGTNQPKYTEDIRTETEINAEQSAREQSTPVSEASTSSPEPSGNSTDDEYVPGFSFDEDSEREEEDYSD